MAQSTLNETDIINSIHNAFATELQHLIYKYVKEDCAGCRVDHPSQIKHTLCLYATEDDWVDLYMQQALKEIDFNKVYNTWRQSLSGPCDENARRLWNTIKDKFEQRTSDEHWLSGWEAHVKQYWKHGHH